MARTASKSIALTVAAGVLTFAVQQLTAGNVTTGAVGLVVGLAVFGGYQYVENTDHERPYNDLVGSIGEDTFKRLSELSADELDRVLEDRQGDGG